MTSFHLRCRRLSSLAQHISIHDIDKDAMAPHRGAIICVLDSGDLRAKQACVRLSRVLGFDVVLVRTPAHSRAPAGASEDGDDGNSDHGCSGRSSDDSNAQSWHHTVAAAWDSVQERDLDYALASDADDMSSSTLLDVRSAAEADHTCAFHACLSPGRRWLISTIDSRS